MTGQTVSMVEDSHNPAFKAGDLVLANVGWQDYGLSDGSDLVRIDASMPQVAASGFPASIRTCGRSARRTRRSFWPPGFK